MNMIALRTTLLGATIVTLAACSNVLTSTKLDEQTSGSSNTVTTYSMPKGLLVIEATATPAQQQPGQETPVAAAPAEHRAVVPAMKYVASVHIVPDTNEQFSINYESSWFTADAVKLSTRNGLLNSLSAHSDDRTHEAVVNLARSVGAAQGFSVPGGRKPDAPPPGTASSTDQQCAPQEDFRLILDLSKLNDLANKPKWLELDYVDGKGGTPNGTVLTGDTYKKAVAACEQGVCTRAARPLRVRIKPCNSSPRDTLVYVPDQTQFTPVRLDRAMFADKCFGIGFTDGMVSEVRIRNASSAENLASMPEDILRALVSIPSELLQLRFNYSIAQRDLTGAELSRLQAEKALQDYVKGGTPEQMGAAPGRTSLQGSSATPTAGSAPTLTEAECALTPAPNAG